MRQYKCFIESLQSIIILFSDIKAVVKEKEEVQQASPVPSQGNDPNEDSKGEDEHGCQMAIAKF